ncbi:MAG: Holliday junction DNA helicase RuvA [Candidatus Omnitrophica bacterium]|nr:Holliday junction DNA helicase RuvA [Candidatus Omnitrophota bacterium]
MIAKISGKIVEKTDYSLVIDVQGVCYEVLVPLAILSRIDDHVDEKGCIQLITYHYIQISPSSGSPVLVGFLNEIERDFFLQFIKVSGIGPRAAVKALNKPISEISYAIDHGDHKYLKTLPGIGLQKAKEVVAKLQGKVGKYGLIQDGGVSGEKPVALDVPAWQDEALDVLLQLQYKKKEAMDMIQKALKRTQDIQTTEELLNEIYKQRISD